MTEERNPNRIERMLSFIAEQVRKNSEPILRGDRYYYRHLGIVAAIHKETFFGFLPLELRTGSLRLTAAREKGQVSVRYTLGNEAELMRLYIDLQMLKREKEEE